MLKGSTSGTAVNHQNPDSPPPQPAPQRDCDRILISVEETAAILGVGRTNVVRLISQGAIKSVKIGRRRLVVRSELQGFVESLLDGQFRSVVSDVTSGRDSCDCRRRSGERQAQRGAIP